MKNEGVRLPRGSGIVSIGVVRECDARDEKEREKKERGSENGEDCDWGV